MTSPDQNYTDWQVGMKAVFVGDFSTRKNEEWAVLYGIEFPQTDDVYTIREIVLIKHLDADYKVGIRLVEIVNPVGPSAKDGGRVAIDELMPPQEITWCPSEFRPLVDRKKDISIFTAMLSPKPAKAGKVRA